MLLEKLDQSIHNITPADPSAERKEILTQLKDAVFKAITNKGMANLNFICTHNSRRSHLSQIWAQTAAFHYGFGQQVFCYSGGTEATALFPAVAKTLEKQGFEILRLSDEANPVYAVKYAVNQPAVIGFSKAFSHPFNPQQDFVAIMTCSQADEGCPFVPGASARIPLTYEDPKLFDDTPEKMSKYLERSEQIASEMFWIFNELKNQLA